MAKPGRRSKYTPETVKRLTDAIRMGATQYLACQYAGISQDTFANWQKQYSEFSDAIKEAEGGAAVGWLAKIEKAANDGNWQAAAWKLERRYPSMYGRTVLENRTPDDIDWDSVPDDLNDAFADGKITLDELRRKLRKRSAG